MQVLRSGMTVLFVKALMACAALPAGAAGDKLQVVYNSHRLADFCFGWNPDSPAGAVSAASEGDGDFKVKLYRDGQLIHTSQPYGFAPHDAPMYYSDTALQPNRVYSYRCEYYARHAPEWQWEYRGDSSATVDTSRCQGTLFNGPHSPFPRTPETWSGAVSVGEVTVKRGVLEITAGAVVTIHDGLTIGANPGDRLGAEIKARQVTFRNAPANQLRKSLAVFGLFYDADIGGNRAYQHTIRPALQGCTFDGIDLRVHAGNANFDVEDNVFESSAILFFLGEDSVVSGNSAAEISLGAYSQHGGAAVRDASQILNNTADLLGVYVHDFHMEGNNLGAVTVYGTNNVFLRNTIGRISAAPAVYHPAPSGHNHYISNHIDIALGPRPLAGSRFYDHDQGGNLLRGNSFHGEIYIESHDNVVCGNYFYCFGGAQPLGGVSVFGQRNLIYNNYFSGWQGDADGRDQGGNNRWFTEKTAGPNIVGGPYLGGNYWARYDGTDADGDGLGDTPYLVPGNQAAQDELPLIGPGELLVSASAFNPVGTPASPQGQPFAVMQFSVKALGNTSDMLLRSIAFTFEGDTNRIPALAGAGLLRGATPGFDNLELVGQGRFEVDRLTFALAESLPAGTELCYTLAYQYRYEDEYGAAAGIRAAGNRMSVDEVRVGANLALEDIVVDGGIPAGEAVSGWITPQTRRFLTGYNAGLPVMAGAAVETTAEILFAWDLYREICVNQNQAVIHTAGSLARPWYLWITNRTRLCAISAYANRPYFRVASCAGVRQDGQALPVSEVLDAYVAEGRVRWARGVVYEDPYAWMDLPFDGEIALHVTAITGNYKGFHRDVITPLRAVFGGSNRVLIDYFKLGQSGGYYGSVRILTDRSTFHASAALRGAPRVLERRGRSLAVAYNASSGDNPAPQEQIANWPPADGPPTSADYDGDGVIDPVVYDETTGTWRILLSSLDYQPVTVADWGGLGYLPVPADYDGDGRTDPAAYSASQGILRIWLSRYNYEEFVISGWGGPGSVVVTADYDGDGIADPALYDPGSGLWRVKLSGSLHAEQSVAGWGGPGYLPVPADYDGDGRADPAVYDTASGAWHIWLSGDAYRVFSLYGKGAAVYLPVPADYDGDGRADPAVVDPLSGRRRVWMSKLNYAPVDF